MDSKLNRTLEKQASMPNDVLLFDEDLSPNEKDLIPCLEACLDDFQNEALTNLLKDFLNSMGVNLEEKSKDKPTRASLDIQLDIKYDDNFDPHAFKMKHAKDGNWENYLKKYAQASARAQENSQDLDLDALLDQAFIFVEKGKLNLQQLRKLNEYFDNEEIFQKAYQASPTKLYKKFLLKTLINLLHYLLNDILQVYAPDIKDLARLHLHEKQTLALKTLQDKYATGNRDLNFKHIKLIHEYFETEKKAQFSFAIKPSDFYKAYARPFKQLMETPQRSPLQQHSQFKPEYDGKDEKAMSANGKDEKIRKRKSSANDTESSPKKLTKTC